MTTFLPPFFSTVTVTLSAFLRSSIFASLPSRVIFASLGTVWLGEKAEPMNCQEMIAAMAEKGYRKSANGQTPAATLYSAILREITAKAKESRLTNASALRALKSSEPIELFGSSDAVGEAALHSLHELRSARYAYLCKDGGVIGLNTHSRVAASVIAPTACLGRNADEILVAIAGCLVLCSILPDNIEVCFQLMPCGDEECRLLLAT